MSTQLSLLFISISCVWFIPYLLNLKAGGGGADKLDHRSAECNQKAIPHNSSLNIPTAALIHNFFLYQRKQLKGNNKKSLENKPLKYNKQEKQEINHNSLTSTMRRLERSIRLSSSFTIDFINALALCKSSGFLLCKSF